MFKRVGLFFCFALLLVSFAITVQAEFGTNWTGVFYDDTSFSDNVRTVTNINGLNFIWQGEPAAGGVTVSEVGEDNFSIRFTSNQTFVADTYRFDLAFDDNVRVFIDNEEVFDDQTGGPQKVRSFNRTMTAGVHALRVDFVEVTGTAVLQFQWFQQGVAPTSIFTAVPSASPIPPLTASVGLGVRGLAVRTGPYLGASMVTVAMTGAEYPVTARSNSEEGVTWYLLNVNDHVGWSSGRYLEFNTDPGGLPGISNVFETLDGAPDTGVFAAPRAVMNVRARPSTRTPIIGSIEWGEEVPLLNRTVQGGQNRWFQVRHNGQVGWIFAPYVSVRGDINAVPIV